MSIITRRTRLLLNPQRVSPLPQMPGAQALHRGFTKPGVYPRGPRAGGSKFLKPSTAEAGCAPGGDATCGGYPRQSHHQEPGPKDQVSIMQIKINRAETFFSSPPVQRYAQDEEMPVALCEFVGYIVCHLFQHSKGESIHVFCRRAHS